MFVDQHLFTKQTEASWIVKGLLDAGVSVHAAVRDPGNHAKVGHLLRAAEGAPGRLTLFRADLLGPGSYAEAMAGCGIVIHTASPLLREVTDPQRDLVDLAFLGIRNVLDSVNAADSVKRVVINPSLIVGPALNDDPTSGSFEVMKPLGQGMLRFGTPRLGLAIVDVRDFARAHLPARCAGPPRRLCRIE